MNTDFIHQDAWDYTIIGQDMEEWTTDFKTTKEKQLQAGNTENKKKRFW